MTKKRQATNNSAFHEVRKRNIGQQISTIWTYRGKNWTITADTFQELHCKTLATTGCDLLPTYPW
jgi:hypothetical protein